MADASADADVVSDGYSEKELFLFVLVAIALLMFVAGFALVLSGGY